MMNFAGNIIDLSHPIEAGMPVYPGDDPIVLAQSRFYGRDHYNAFTLRAGMHAGTHVDAPMHLLPDDARMILQLPLERFCGPGFLLDGLEDPRDIPPDRCVLILTGHDARYGQPDYFSLQPQLSMALCERILSARPRCIGLDMPSPDLPPFAVHKRLLAAGVPIVENLTHLSALRGKAFSFIALPLRIRAEASLVRAVACIH